MKIELYPKSLLESAWKNDLKLFSMDTESPPFCLRCGRPLNKHLAANSLSRYADVYICSSCGTQEALLDFVGTPLPLPDWHAMSSGHLTDITNRENPVLVVTCGFKEVFQHVASEIKNTSRPGNELVYSRSDYNGYKWWTTWFPCQKEPLAPQLIEEIDQFHMALFQRPEFKTLSAMKQLCLSCAEPTSDRSEFNLYSQTAHLNIWLRLITRNRDYNLYIHFYQK